MLAPNSTEPILIGDYWYPFMNEIARGNLGYGSDMRAALDHVKDWSVAVDGGAQIGRVANRLAQSFDKVYAVEIAKENYECLIKNKKQNVIAIHGCLGNLGSFAHFGYEPDKHPDSPVYRALPAAGQVPGITIDELQLPSCGFVKLDLQGFDYFALLGGEYTIRRFHPVIYIEIDSSCCERYGINVNAPELFLSGLGYHYVGAEDGNRIWA